MHGILSRIIIPIAALLGASDISAQGYEFEYFRGSIDTAKASFWLILNTSYTEGDTQLVHIGTVLPDATLDPRSYYAARVASDDNLSLVYEDYDLDTESSTTELMSGTHRNGTFIGRMQYGGQDKLFAFERKTDPWAHQVYNHYHLNTYTQGNVRAKGDFSFSAILPKDSTIANILLSSMFERPTALPLSQIDQEIRDFEQAWSQSFRQEAADLISEYTSEPNDSIDDYIGAYRSYHEDVKPYIISPDLLTYELVYYTYFGGAHGMYSIEYIHIDPKTKAQISTFDIIQEQYQDRVTALIDKLIRKRYHIPQGVHLQDAERSPFIVDSTTFTKNITISKQGITFHYALYEMTPYAYGYFSQFVPMEQLLPYLTDTYKQFFIQGR